MWMYQLINELKRLIPVGDTWEKGENYGEFNISDYEADVYKVLFCVTPTKAVVDYFIEGEYHLLISHHPFIAGRGIPQFIAHTAFDCCEGGLNDMWKNLLQIKNAKHFDDNLGWYGEIEPIVFDDLVRKVSRFSGNIVGECFSDKNMIKSVVVCTGLGGMVIDQAAETNADCYILGENIQSAKGIFPSSIEIGHTLSERVGIDFFRKHFADEDIEFDLAPLNIDVFAREVYCK